MNARKYAARAATTLSAAALITALATPNASAMQQAFLVQNSGWMEPFYSDPASQLKPLVAAVAQAVASPGDTLFTLAFNQTHGANISPKLLGKGQSAAEVAGLLAPLAVAKKGGGAAFADTDFQEAVGNTISTHFGAKPGILWIFTNNKNSPGNDPATAERNRDFYKLLHLDPAIAKTVVFPLRMAVRGKEYEAKGLMVYALAYGQPAADALDGILAGDRLPRVLTDLPARLKPVDRDSVRIVPKSVRNSANIQPSLGTDKRTLVLDVDAADIVPKVELQATLQNQFHPYVISTASVSATLKAGGQELAAAVIPDTVRGLPPGAHHPVEVHFTLPMAQVPSPWSAQALSAMGKRVSLPMTVRLSLGGQRLVLADGYASKLQELFPGDPISEVFSPPDSVRASEVLVPVLVRIQYPLLPVVALMAGLLAGVVGLAGLGMLSARYRRCQLLVDGIPRYVMLKPFSPLAVKDGDGQTVGVVRRGLVGGHQVVSASEGHTVVAVR